MSDVRSSEKGEKEEEKEMGKFFSFILTCLQNGKYYVIQRGGGIVFQWIHIPHFRSFILLYILGKEAGKKEKRKETFFYLHSKEKMAQLRKLGFWNGNDLKN